MTIKKNPAQCANTETGITHTKRPSQFKANSYEPSMKKTLAKKAIMYLVCRDVISSQLAMRLIQDGGLQNA